MEYPRAMETNKELKSLFKKYLNGQCTDIEILQLEKYFDAADEGLKQLIAAYFHEQDTIEPTRQAAADELATKAYAQVRAGIARLENVSKKRPLFSRVYVRYAAAVLLVASSGLFFLVRKSESPQDRKIIETEILPGYNQATLTLADGRTISLDSAQSGIVIDNEDIKYNNGNSVLAEKDESPRAPDPNTQYATITTPRGGQYQIILSDGTKVWLNAASTLRYPIKFTGDGREVELEGEAYFQVRKKGSPFIVKSHGQEITVLGTSFNIAAYADENETKTTVVEGKVQVSQGTERILLIPGEQSVLNNGFLTTQKADVEAIIAWKSGKFYFKNTPFREMIMQVARWYDIDVAYESTVPKATFSGDMKRSVSLMTVLDLLKLSGIRFHLEERKLIIE